MAQPNAGILETANLYIWFCIPTVTPLAHLLDLNTDVWIS